MSPIGIICGICGKVIKSAVELLTMGVGSSQSGWICHDHRDSSQKGLMHPQTFEVLEELDSERASHYRAYTDEEAKERGYLKASDDLPNGWLQRLIDRSQEEWSCSCTGCEGKEDT